MKHEYNEKQLHHTHFSTTITIKLQQAKKVTCLKD